MRRIQATDVHLRKAFEAMRWTGITFDQAIADATRYQVLRARATAIAAREFKATHAREQRVEHYHRPDGTWWSRRVSGGWTDQPVLQFEDLDAAAPSEGDAA